MTETERTLLMHERAILQNTVNLCRLDQKLTALKATLREFLPQEFETVLADADVASPQLDADSDTIEQFEKRIRELKEHLDS